MGPISGSPLARLPPARGHGDAGLQFSGLAGGAPAPPPAPPRPPPRPGFPLGLIRADARCQRSIARSLGGCATKPCNGGSQLIGSSNSAHNGANKVVLVAKANPPCSIDTPSITL